MNALTDMPRLLTEALERLGIAVERVRLDDHVSGGGLCVIKGRRVVYLDRHNSIEHELQVLTEALHQAYDGHTFLPPVVREWLDAHPQNR